MQKSFLIFFLLLFVSEARSYDEQCFYKAFNYNSALLVSRKWVNDLKDPKFNPKELCVYPENNPITNAIVKKNRKTSLIMINADNQHSFRTKDFGFLDNEDFSSDVSDNELCVYVAQKPREDATCELTSEYLKEAGEAYFNAGGPMIDFCKKNIEELAHRVRKCSRSTK